MSGWAMVVIVAIIVWGVVEYAKARAGIVTDEDGNERIAPREDGRTAVELEAARRELAEIKERVKVLERIATDSNSGDARERARISAEIEALRGLPPASKEEPGQ
jgi:hypothetical protein